MMRTEPRARPGTPARPDHHSRLTRWISPYLRLMRLHSPTGAMLLFLPCGWGLALAGSPDQTFFFYLGLCFIGALVMRAAGCVINDVIDQNLDRQVARTAQRPVASGEISVARALMVLAGLLAAGLVVLIALPPRAILWGVAALPLVVVYPLAKRVTHWPQLVLGLTFNWGIFVGWFAVREDGAASMIVFYIAAVIWTVAYDTIYAYQDVTDDRKIGIKSSAVFLQERGKLAVILFYIITLGLMVLACILAQRPGLAFVFVALAGGWIAWHVHRWQPSNPTSCFRCFRANVPFAILVLISLMVG